MMKNMTFSISKISEQSNLLNRKFEGWKGHLEQVDDVCIIGVKI